MMPVNVLVEGIADEPVAKKLLKHVGLEVGMVYGRRGKAHFTQNHWRPTEGERRSESLRRCINALSTLTSF